MKHLPLGELNGKIMPMQAIFTEGQVLAAEIFPNLLVTLLLPSFGVFLAGGTVSLVLIAYISDTWSDIHLYTGGLGLIILPYFW